MNENQKKEFEKIKYFYEKNKGMLLQMKLELYKDQIEVALKVGFGLATGDENLNDEISNKIKDVSIVMSEQFIKANFQ